MQKRHVYSENEPILTQLSDASVPLARRQCLS